MALPKIILFSGEVKTIPVSVKTNKGIPVDITGAALYVTCKRHVGDGDDEAVIDVKVTSHTDGEGGLSGFPVDLSEFAFLGARTSVSLIADLVIKDSAGDVTNEGQYEVEIHKSVTGSTAD